MSKKVLTYIRENLTTIIKFVIIYGIALALGIVIYTVTPIGKEYDSIITTTFDSAMVDNFDGLNIIITGIKNNFVIVIIILFSLVTYICPGILCSTIALKGVSTGIYISSLFSVFGIINGIKVVFLDVIIPQLFCVFGLILVCLLVLDLYNMKKNSEKMSLNSLFIALFSISLISFSIVFEQLISSICINIYTNIN